VSFEVLGAVGVVIWSG